jgi:hypothetical protein
MAPPSIRNRCFLHGDRVAVARCGSCGRHFCRECVTEHEGRMICGGCLRRGAGPKRAARRWLRGVGAVAHTVAAVFVAWLFFHWIGLIMLEIPTSMHEGTLWNEAWWEEEP